VAKERFYWHVSSFRALILILRHKSQLRSELRRTVQEAFNREEGQIVCVGSLHLGEFWRSQIACRRRSATTTASAAHQFGSFCSEFVNNQTKTN